MKPTDEQIKKFWEKCGAKPYQDTWGTITGWTINHEIFSRLPPIDLNNLFKYGVPKLQDRGEIVSLIALEHLGFECCISHFLADEPFVQTKIYDNPALALFWALCEVVG